MIADARHHHQVLDAAKRPVARVMRNNPFGHNFADSG
jgi:hypothetical protein